MSDQPNAEPVPWPAVASSRRTVLRAAGLLAVTGGAVAVAACAADGDPAAAPTTVGRGRILLSPRAHVHRLVGGELA